MALEPSDPRKRASTRRAVRKHIHKYGQPRDQRERGLALLDQAEGQNSYEKASWLKAQREALRLLKEMDRLISRDFVAARVAEMGHAVRERLEQLPDRLAHELEGQDADRIRARLRDEIHDALVALANGLELGASPGVDAKREMRKGNRGIRRARAVEMPPTPTLG
jgi:hypothetical protein